MAHATKQETKNLTDTLRHSLSGVVTPIAAFFLKLGISANTVTLLGLAGHVLAAFFVASGWIAAGGITVLLLAPFDFLDGTLARLSGSSSKFGGFLDSVTDRYSEFFILGGLLWYYLQASNELACMLTYLAAAGSILVSYVRARAEGLGLDCKVGLLTRVERYIVLVPALIFNFPLVGLWILAVFTNITALQRIFYVRKKALANVPPSGMSSSL